jgi:hypothetical protein
MERSWPSAGLDKKRKERREIFDQVAGSHYDFSFFVKSIIAIEAENSCLLNSDWEKGSRLRQILICAMP